MTSFKPVTAALRTLEVLAIVNRLQQPSFARIHKMSGLSSATVVRILETLEAAGMVARDPERALYVPTSKTLTLSAGYRPSQHLDVVAKPILAELQRQIGWPSDVAIFDRDCMVVVQTSRSEGRLFFNRQPGYRAPVLGTSLGMAFLAHSPVDLKDELIAMMIGDPAPWNDLARAPKKLELELSEVRSQGYATMHPDYGRQSYTSTVSAIAVPVLIEERAVAALNVMFLTEALSPQQAGDKLASSLKAAASRIAAALSATSWARDG